VVSPSIELAGRTIGAGQPPFVIAEAGVNHNGRAEIALALVDAAADAGADAVKFQTFSADALATAQAPQAAYQRERATAASQVDMLRGLELSADGLRAARDRAHERGLFFLSTPFDLGALRLLVELEVKAFKIGSGDLTNVVLLRAVAAQRLPILLSTGMATLAEVDAAVDVVRRAGDPPLVVLQCTSAYPAAAADVNLMVMEQLRQRYGIPIGFSDHTLGMGASIAAAALGAAIIEKHLTIDRNLPGPDHAASLPPGEFSALVAGVRDAHAALGEGTKAPTPGEAEMRLIVRRSLVANRPLVAGQTISEGDLDAMRPATGISPLRLDEVVGRRAARDLPERVPLMPDDLDPALPA
jgi:N,N'-diacetyllegionaminate synthase